MPLLIFWSNVSLSKKANENKKTARKNVVAIIFFSLTLLTSPALLASQVVSTARAFGQRAVFRRRPLRAVCSDWTVLSGLGSRSASGSGLDLKKEKRVIKAVSGKWAYSSKSDGLNRQQLTVF